MKTPPSAIMQRLPQTAWTRLQEFCALGGDATFIWPRWIILRAVGLTYIMIFWSTLAESHALLGPDGIVPVRHVFASLAAQYPNPVEAFLRAPSLFWLSTSEGMINGLQWTGLAAAVAVVLNLWPRMSLFACWLIFLSFANSGPFFSITAPDPLMLEMALLCIPLAPPGFRPGLGEQAAPRPIAWFSLRWMLLCIMVEAGLSKFVYGSPEWRNFTAMDYMYESAPFPTILAYWDHQLPHIQHVLEILLTFVAEAVAPVVMIFGRRGSRWFAFAVWAVFQLGIQLTNNFGWLNLASIALAVVLLDDQMLVGLARRVRLRRLGDFLAARVTAVSALVIGPWPRWGLRVALGVHLLLTVFFYVVAPARIPLESVPTVISRPVILLFAGFRSANNFPLFGTIQTTRHEVEFLGSNDGGETWRSYDSRYQAQRVDRMGPFIAPWYPRLDAVLARDLATKGDPAIHQAVASHLLRRDPDLLKIFRRDPFPDRPPTMIRMPIYRLRFTDAQTLRATGHYWHKDYVGEYAPVMFLNERGEIVSNE